ncbi:MAG: hypothetical protein ACKO6Q_06135 [Bacteroidota bacterium]
MSTDPHHTEFEQWLRTETDRLRLFADASVWERIRNRIHRRRFYPFVGVALMIISGAVTWVMLDQPDLPLNYASAPAVGKNRTGTNQPSNTSETAATSPAPYRTNKSDGKTSALSFLLRTNETAFEQSSLTEQTEAPATVNTNEDPSEPSRTDIESSVSLDIVAQKASVLPSKTIPTPAAIVLANPVDPLEQINEDRPQDPAKPIVSALKPEQFQTIESVVNAYHGKRTRKSWKMQLTVSPTVSYRKLIENTTALQAARSVMSMAPAIAVPELENVVNHKPDLGLQVGLSVNRQLTERLTFVGGLQFNINKYDIRAYRGSQEIATIGLNSGGGTGSVSAYTNYRSSGGVWENWLANYYFSASAPIGFQYRITGNKKLSWGVGSTLQPSLVLNNKGYVLSTDYKNYVEAPSLVHPWNLNGQVETFIGFQKGKTRYTLGPQARYQILSSYEKAYPLQEHLFDIGIKLGVGL